VAGAAVGVSGRTVSRVSIGLVADAYAGCSRLCETSRRAGAHLQGADADWNWNRCRPGMRILAVHLSWQGLKDRHPPIRRDQRINILRST
jgi:hypothetical protein